MGIVTPVIAQHIAAAAKMPFVERRAYLRRKITRHGTLLCALSHFIGLANEVAGEDAIQTALARINE